jgi:small subunit ribosomal protein S6
MSSPSSHTYETIYVLKSGLSETDANTIHQKVDNVITKFQGSLKHRDDWGLKELAYPIENETTGRYVVVNYTGTSGVVEEIERHFKISGDVVRFLTVAVESDYDYTKSKKQIHLSEEEVKRNRELRKKGGESGFRDAGFRG